MFKILYNLYIYIVSETTVHLKDYLSTQFSRITNNVALPVINDFGCVVFLMTKG